MFWSKARAEVADLKLEKVAVDQEREAARLDLQLSLRRFANHLASIPIEEGVIGMIAKDPKR